MFYYYPKKVLSNKVCLENLGFDGKGSQVVMGKLVKFSVCLHGINKNSVVLYQLETLLMRIEVINKL